jgi:serine/threonine-protein kinase
VTSSTHTCVAPGRLRRSASNISNAIQRLINFCGAAGKAADAKPILRECLGIREKKLPDDCVLFNTKSMLGGALAGQDKFQEAEPFLIEGYHGMKEREEKIPANAKTRLPEAIQRLVDLYTAWEKLEEAEKWKVVLNREAM